jgi:hypothetical protein
MLHWRLLKTSFVPKVRIVLSSLLPHPTVLLGPFRQELTWKIFPPVWTAARACTVTVVAWQNLSEIVSQVTIALVPPRHRPRWAVSQVTFVQLGPTVRLVAMNHWTVWRALTPEAMEWRLVWNVPPDTHAVPAHIRLFSVCKANTVPLARDLRFPYVLLARMDPVTVPLT